jgi:predicted molibdopterin-dependent oxidoreductase YjgC
MMPMVSNGAGESLYRDGIFPTADGRAKLHLVSCETFVEHPDAEYDFILNTGRTVETLAHPH